MPTTTEEPSLCPVQRRVAEAILAAMPVWRIAVVSSGTGIGRTTVLRALHARLGGTFLTMKEFIEAHAARHPLAMEETFYQLVLGAMQSSPVVFVDDLHLLGHVLSGQCPMYPRQGLIHVALEALCAYALEAGRTLIIGFDGTPPEAVNERAYVAHVEDFHSNDYASLCLRFWGETPAALRVDYEKIHRFAPKLNAHQLKGACAFVTPAGHLDTERFIDFLRSQRMASNVDLEEVQAVDLHDLKGLDDVIAALEANVIVPLENDALAAELDLKPKRGVLLAGPPGTGKTTVGRALAHRLKGKFFLVDGTFISGTAHFYNKIQQVFHAAKLNAPAVIFIDDTDVIFEDGQQAGLYRYLLTMLDGLESASAGRICVMMTAMNVAALPPALIRSGRIELWLETRLPDAAGREAILRGLLAKVTGPMGQADAAAMAAATDGLTGADLKRLIEDGKIACAYDRSRGATARPATEYFLQALQAVRTNKERYAKAEAQAREQRPIRPPWYDAMGMMAAAGAMVTMEE